MKSQKAAEESHNIFFPDTVNHSLTKFVRSRWLDITLVLFSVFSGPRPKKKELGQYRAILTAPLVNIPFLGAIAQSD